VVAAAVSSNATWAWCKQACLQVVEEVPVMPMAAELTGGGTNNSYKTYPEITRSIFTCLITSSIKIEFFLILKETLEQCGLCTAAVSSLLICYGKCHFVYATLMTAFSTHGQMTIFGNDLRIKKP